VATAVESVNGLTQAAASTAEEMTGATEQLSTMAQRLHGLVAPSRIGLTNANV